MARETEPAFNARFAELLGRRHPLWEGVLGSERTGVLRDGALRPDVVVLHPGGLPVVVETEFEPARTVERDAIARLGAILAQSGSPVEQTLALRIPEALREGEGDLARRIEGARFRYCLFTGTAQRPERWPPQGWIEGGIDDVATAIELAALSERRIAQGVTILELGIENAADALRRRAGAGALQAIAHTLRQQESPQTRRMAMAIVANALCFHTAVAGAHGIPPLSGLHGRVAGGPLKTRLLACWRFVLAEINYWPIFAVASDLLDAVPDGAAQAILARLERLANDLAALGATSQHDLSGRMFQRLIADRKFLATFYTLPASAALLAELAVARLAVDWSRPAAVAGLRMADFACGTGALIGAAYRAARSRHRLAGGDDGALHAAMMEGALIAADIMPAATHLTAATLSSAHPDRTFADTRIVTLPYGEQEGGRRPAIGALDLIEDEVALSLFGTGRRRVSGHGGEREDDEAIRTSLAHGSMDLVIMNPPFTRPTNHEAVDVPVPSFAGFRTSADEQRAMSQRLKRIRGPASHGNAGLASNFVDLAHVKLAAGGTLALVLPASCLQGRSWRGMRDLLAARYRDPTVVSIAATGATDRAFSADTGMAEVLIVATRKGSDGEEPPGGRACFANLDRRPATLLEAVETARAIRRLPAEAEQGILYVGSEARAGCFVGAPFHETGCAGLREPLLAPAAMALREGRLDLPRLEDSLPLPVTALGELGARGPLHRDINGREGGARPRGPFDIHPVAGAKTASYPVLWSHDAAREVRLEVAMDAEGRPRTGQAARAAALWNRAAARLHFNQDFRINSQPLAACLTPQAAIGGRAWPGFRPHDDAWQAPLLLWANTTLGLLAFWWLGTRQQQGRAVLTLSGLPGLAVLDPRALSAGQLAQAGAMFDAFRERPFLPANEAWRDETRQALDRAVLIDWLRLSPAVLEPLAVLRRQWCAEPSVHGGKSTRPPG